MIISLSEIFNLPLGENRFDVTYEPDTFDGTGIDYPITSKEDCVLNITRIEKKRVRITLKGGFHFSVPCDSCLEPQDIYVPVDFDDEIDLDEVNSPETPDYNYVAYINGYDLDVNRLIYEEILLGFPMKVLCVPDCKGLCKVCGANLNLGDCGCDRSELDPRMSVIRDIFNQVKEV